MRRLRWRPLAELTREDETALDAMRASLLRRGRPELGPEQGDQAYDRHLLLATDVLRAARLYRGGGDGETWCKYVTAFFPDGRNGAEDAKTLWLYWRTSLLKSGQPIVPITHGQSWLHWQREGGRPVLNLEDAWDDYAYSVDRFIEHLRQHPDDRANTLRRWHKRAWTVRDLKLDSAIHFTTLHPGAASASVIAPP